MKYLCIAEFIIISLFLAPTARYNIIPHAQAENRVTGQNWADNRLIQRHPLTVAQIYATAPILRPIFACESSGDKNGTPRQFKSDGGILWGHDPKTGLEIKRDVGEAQINTWVHEDEIAAQHLNVKTNEWDNVWFGYELYLESGTQPWIASKATCWGKPS
jgi:hypothetical protein